MNQLRCTNCKLVFRRKDAGTRTETEYLSGRAPATQHFSICPRCGDEGLEEVVPVVCKACDGDGLDVEGVTCAHCFGEGVIDVKKEA